MNSCYGISWPRTYIFRDVYLNLYIIYSAFCTFTVGSDEHNFAQDEHLHYDIDNVDGCSISQENVTDSDIEEFWDEVVDSLKEVNQVDEVLTHHNLKGSRKKVNRCLNSEDMGRIPCKIALEFSNLTADEWKNWTLLCSIIALSDILPEDHLKCWQFYVSACNILSSSVASLNNIEEAHEMMQSFLLPLKSFMAKSS